MEQGGLSAEDALKELLRQEERREREELRSKLEDIANNPHLTDEQKFKVYI